MAVLAFLAAAVAACGAPPGVVFRTVIPDLSGERPIPVTLGDGTGLVVGIGPAQFDSGDFRDAGVLADPTSPNAFILTWLGGMCHSDASVVFSSAGSGYDLGLAVHEKLGLGCPAAGVLRGVRIETSHRIALGSIGVSGDRAIELVLHEDCGPLEAAGTSDSKIACFALLDATTGGRTEDFASVTVSPDDGACPGTECSTAAGIAAQPWRVEATDRAGQHHTWRCAYAAELATCTVVAAPAST